MLPLLTAVVGVLAVAVALRLGTRRAGRGASLGEVVAWLVAFGLMGALFLWPTPAIS